MQVHLSRYKINWENANLTPSVLQRRSQKSIMWQPERNLEPPSRPLTLSRWPNPFEWTTACKRWVVFSNWWNTQSSTSSSVITWLQDLHLPKGEDPTKRSRRRNARSTIQWERGRKWGSPGLGEVQEITTADARLVVPTDGTPVGLDYEMVPLPAHGMPAPPFKIKNWRSKSFEDKNQHLLP